MATKAKPSSRSPTRLLMAVLNVVFAVVLALALVKAAVSMATYHLTASPPEIDEPGQDSR